jgi:hypothetical protein
MALLTVTLGAGATQFTKSPIRAMGMKVWQGTSASFVGDSPTVTTSTGIPVIAATATIPPLDISGFTSGAINLNQWYAIGTAADVVHVQYTIEE